MFYDDWLCFWHSFEFSTNFVIYYARIWLLFLHKGISTVYYNTIVLLVAVYNRDIFPYVRLELRQLPDKLKMVIFYCKSRSKQIVTINIHLKNAIKNQQLNYKPTLTHKFTQRRVTITTNIIFHTRTYLKYSTAICPMVNDNH